MRTAKLALLAALVLARTGASQPDAWIAVGPAAAREALVPLMEHRAAQGLRTRFIAIEDLEGEGGVSGRVRSAVQALRPPPRHLVLVGDGGGESGWVLPPLEATGPGDGRPRNGIRIRIRGREVRAYDHASDVPFGDLDGDGLPEVHVGRLPVRNAEELRAVVAKILRYERGTAAGLWQREATFVTGEGHYGAVADMALEVLFRRVVKETIPPTYDMEVTYANPRSAYFWPPEEFSARVRERLEDGSLFFTYVGHGSHASVDFVHFGDERHPVMRIADVRGLARRGGAPIFTILACDTASFVEHDCIGEVLFREPAGPVGFIGAVIRSSPYGNGILGYELARRYFDPELETLGAVLDGARRALVKGEPAPLRRTIDKLADRMDSSVWTQEQQAWRHVSMYFLFGDPALRIRRPRDAIALEAPAEVARGATLEVTGRAPGAGGTARITLEIERLRYLHRLPARPDPSDPDFKERVRSRHRAANEKVAASVDVPVQDGRFRAELPVAETLRTGTYWIKAAAVRGGALLVGHRVVKVVRGTGE